MKKYQLGFNLIELMVVIAIMGIMASIVLPSFTKQAASTRRSDAVSSLQEIQIKQAAWRNNHTTYTATMADFWLAADEDGTWPTGTETRKAYYTLAIVVDSATATGFIATATPVATSGQANDECGVFAINEKGPETSGTYANADCW